MPFSEWKECLLEDVCVFQRGFDLPSSSRIKGNYPIVASNGIVEYHGAYKVKGPGVVIGRSGNIGGSQYVKTDFWPLNTTLWIKDFKNNHPKFIYYFLQTFDFKQYNSGSGVPTLNRNHIHTIPVSVPFELKEQQAIADVLGSLDDKIELNRKMNKTLEDMAQAIFKSWFVDFDPVKAKAEGRTIEGLSQEILDLFPDSFEDSELGEIPKGWSIYEFDDILEITSSKRIFMSDYVSEGIPFYRSKEIIEKQKGNNVSTELFITKQKYNEIKDKFSVPKVGDILLTSVGTLGVSYLVKNSDEFYFKDGNLTWFKNYTKTFPEIIYYWLRSSMGQSRLEEISIGSTQKALTIASMKKINIILPSVEIQKELNMTFKIIRDNIDFHNDQIETLSTMRDTLLPKLISGELRIPDAEKLVEGVV